MIDALDEMLAPHLFPPSKDGSDPRKCPNCANGRIGLKLGRFGGFVGCSNYPECKFTRQLTVGADGQGGGMRKLGEDPDTGLEITVRGGRFGSYLQLGEPTKDADGEAVKPKRASLPKGVSQDEVTLEQAIKLLSLPREIGKSPEDGEPIIAGIGRFGSYVKHGKTYANLDAGEDVTSVGLNRAITLIAEKRANPGQGPPVRRRSRQAAGRASAEGRPGHRQERPLRALRDQQRRQRHVAGRQDAGDDHARRGDRAARRSCRAHRRRFDVTAQTPGAQGSGHEGRSAQSAGEGAQEARRRRICQAQGVAQVEGRSRRVIGWQSRDSILKL